MADVQVLYDNVVPGGRFGVTGSYNNGNPTNDWGQCTAIPHRDEQLSGIPLIYGNAIDMLANAPDSTHIKTYYKSGLVPPRNATVIWGQNNVVKTGPAGHVAKASGEGDATHFKSLDQNWPTGSAPQWIWHTYDGVVGWYILKSEAQGGATVAGTPSTTLHSTDSAIDTAIQAFGPGGDIDGRRAWAGTRTIQSVLDEIGSDNNALWALVRDGKLIPADQTDSLKKQIKSQQDQITELSSQLKQAQQNQGGFTEADRATLNWLQKAIATIFRISTN